MTFIKLFDSELKIMDIVWDKEPVSAKEISLIAAETIGWNKNTTYTIIKKLMDKRYWLPFGIANQYSLLNLISKFTTKTVLIRQELPQVTTTNSIMAAKNYFPLEYKTDLLKNVLNVASLIWIIVSCAIILILVLLYFFTKLELKTAQLISGNIYKSDKITAPAVYGIIQPKIIIPAQIAAGDLDYILLHEQVHIARRDNLSGP